MGAYEKVIIKYDGRMYSVEGAAKLDCEKDISELIEFILYLTTTSIVPYKMEIDKKSIDTLKPTHRGILERLVEINDMINPEKEPKNIMKLE